jgi:hypothetical protein
MKTIRFVRIIAALIALLAITSQSLAATPGFATPREAAEGAHRVVQYQQNLLDEGFVLKSVEDHPIYYFAPPQNPFLWGTIVYTYARPADGWSLLVDYVEVTVSIRHTDDGYKFASMSAREYTVH